MEKMHQPVKVVVQYIATQNPTPSESQFIHWINTALETICQMDIKTNQYIPQNSEVCIRIVDKKEMQSLNNHFRGKPKPTNVLAFPYFETLSPEIYSEHPEYNDKIGDDDTAPQTNTQATTLVGDIAICAEVVIEEARSQGILVDSHWAHLTIHGMLHLMGYTHDTDTTANIMETLEVHIMNQLGYSNPYE